MTQEQLDELHSDAADDSLFVPASKVLPRLLEERRRALDALREVMKEEDDHAAWRQCYADADADEALAFCEEAAP